MNTLSWLLYFAEISERISGAAFFLTCTSAIVFAVFGFMYMIIPSREQSDSFQTNAPKARNVAAAVFFISLFGLLFPSQNTIYLIIASEAAEVVATDTNTRAFIGDIQKIVTLKLDQIADDMIPQEYEDRNNRSN